GKDNAGGEKIHEALGEMENPEAPAGVWLLRLAEADRLPLGVLEMPSADGQAPLLRHLPVCRKMTNALRDLARAALANGKPEAAVEHLARILLLSRTLRNKAPWESYLAGVEAEETALQG